MSKNIRHLSMALAVLMVLGLFTAFPAFAVSANDSATEFNEIFVGDPNCGDECAKLNVVAPTEVNVGDEFEMEFTWYDITYSEVYPGEVTASIDVYFLIDTRYIVYTGFKGIDGLESKDVENMCSGPKEGKDYGEDYMQPLQIAVAIKTDEGREHCKHSFVIRVGLKAVAAGTTDPAEWTSCMLGSYPYGTGFTVIADVDNANGAEFGWSVKVVDPNAELSEESSAESSEEPNENEAEVPVINVASDALYKGSDMANGSNATSSYGEPDWNEYHAGRLNDGVIADGASNKTTGLNIEIYKDGYVGGTAYVYFKLEAEQTIREVVAYANSRDNSANRGYPSSFKVYVGNSEDVASATLLGEATTADTSYVRKYTASGKATGSYVILELGISSPYIMIALTEVEIMADDTPINHAPNADYKGEGTDNGTSGNYCEAPGTDWEVYHDGKLNDGVIPEGDSDATKGSNVEFWHASMTAGIINVFFKFDYEVDVREVIAYMNNRTSNANTGYPEKIDVFVGNSEDLAEATYIGEATTTDPEGAVRAYSVKGNAKGTYVILQFTAGAKWRITASEIAILGFGDAPAEPELPALDAPVLSGNLDKMETYEAPTITWAAVEGATSYDVYLDGSKVAEGITELTYTPDMDPVVAYGSNTSYTKLQVVAKGDGVASADSALSESYNFFYVEKPLDLRGNRVTSADIIIDPGHGGSQPGACLEDRQEKDDTLAMSLKLGETFEKLGYTVAFTRIEDVDDGLMSRAAKVNAGNFKAFICVHRNAYNGLANGIETLYETGDTLDQAFAQLVQDELVALGIFTDRGLKPRDNLVVTNNASDSVPTILVELAFIDNVKDNEAFDTYNDAIALAIVKGTMKQLNDAPAVNGTITVGDTEYTYNGTEINVALDAIIGEGFTADVKFDLYNRLGITNVLGTDGVDGFDVDCTINSAEKGATATGTNTINATYAEAGTYTVSYTMEDMFGNKYTFLVVTVNVQEPNAELGDVNGDGVVDNLDAAFILKYDAATIDLTDDQLAVGDVNKDGEVDNLDAAFILKYDAGIIESL